MQEKDTTNNDVTEESLGTVEEEAESTGAGEEVSTEVSTDVLDITPSTIVEKEGQQGKI